MKRIFFVIVCTIGCTAMGCAQTPKDDFESFRKGMMSNYGKFRKSVLEEYDRYLDGVWTEYKAFAGRKRDTTPKPKTQPKVDADMPATPTTPAEPLKPIEPTKPVEPAKPTVPSVPTTPTTPAVPTKPTEPTPPVQPTQPAQPTQPVSPAVPPTPAQPTRPTPSPSIRGLEFDFYGMTLRAPLMDVCRVKGVADGEFGEAWRRYEMKGGKVAVTEALKALAAEKGLNDWFLFQLVQQYVNTLAKSGTMTDRVVLQHYLLTNMGYGVRLARTQSEALLLVPVAQTMYSKSYTTIDKKQYYLFTDTKEVKDIGAFYTCDLPSDADYGHDLNLMYAQGANIGHGSSQKRTLTDGVLTVNGEINTTLMEMLRHYPQIDIPGYAASNVLPPLHSSIISQLRPQIEGLSQRDAANRLMHFLQYAFEYATDDDLHGYEKPYFIEENFYYPKNDCEDRAIFFAFLVRNLLGLDVHLVQFPGHECTAVNFTDSSIDGDAYLYKGKKYLICDPTYIGANIGMCMPSYKNANPKIELW